MRLRILTAPCKFVYSDCVLLLTYSLCNLKTANPETHFKINQKLIKFNLKLIKSSFCLVARTVVLYPQSLENDKGTFASHSVCSYITLGCSFFFQVFSKKRIEMALQQCSQRSSWPLRMLCRKVIGGLSTRGPRS